MSDICQISNVRYMSDICQISNGSKNKNLLIEYFQETQETQETKVTLSPLFC